MGRFSLVVLGVSCLLGTPSVASSCPTTGLDLSGSQWLMVEGDCTVHGNITVRGTSLLIIADARFVLKGNLAARDGAIISIQRSEFIIDNQISNEFGIDMSGSALLWFNRTIFRASQNTDANYFVSYLGRNTSKLWITDSSLTTDHSWVLSRFVDSAKVTVSNSQNFPSEIFVENQATARVEAGSITSMWIPFDPGARATMVLPDQSAGRYSFEFGRRTAGVAGIGYDIVILDSLVRLGVVSRPLSQATIVGRGQGSPTGGGEISIGYSLTGVFAPQTISGLRPGYQANTRLSHQGRTLILNNVELDPVGWSVWVSVGVAVVTVRDSILNEVASWGGRVEVLDSVLQWAVLGAVGPTASVVVRDSSIHSQLVFATLGGRIEVHDSVVHGSPLAANDNSTVQVSGGLMAPSGAASPCDLHDGLTSSGVPLCNPFVAPGVDSSITTVGSGQVTIGGTPPAATSDLHLVGWSDPQTVGIGGSFTYHVQAGNAGPDPATGVSVRLKTPPQATVDSFSPACALSGRDLVCTVGDLSVFSASEWLTVTYRVASGLTPAVGEATVMSNQFDPDVSNHLIRLTNAIQ